MWEGKVYIVKKKGGKWKEIYVRLPADAIRELKHKQTVYIYKEPQKKNKTLNPKDKKLLELFKKLFLLCFRDEGLRKHIMEDASRAEIIRVIAPLLRGETK